MAEVIIKAEFLAGTTIRHAAKEAIRISSILKCGVRFDFNGVDLCVWPCTVEDDIVRAYNRRIKKAS